MWSKKRRKIMREAVKNEQNLPASVKADCEKAVAASENLANDEIAKAGVELKTSEASIKTSLGLLTTSSDNGAEVIPGLDMLDRPNDNSKSFLSDGSSKYGNKSANDVNEKSKSLRVQSLSQASGIGNNDSIEQVQQQLLSMLSAFGAGQGQVTVGKLVQHLGIGVSADTKVLYEKLEKQLNDMLAAATKTQLLGNIVSSGVSASSITGASNVQSQSQMSSEDATRRVYGNVPSFRDKQPDVSQQSLGLPAGNMNTLLSQLMAQSRGGNVQSTRSSENVQELSTVPFSVQPSTGNSASRQSSTVQNLDGSQRRYSKQYSYQTDYEPKSMSGVTNDSPASSDYDDREIAHRVLGSNKAGNSAVSNSTSSQGNFSSVVPPRETMTPSAKVQNYLKASDSKHAGISDLSGKSSSSYQMDSHRKQSTGDRGYRR